MAEPVEIRNIDVKELKSLMDQGRVLLVDVRERREWMMESIPGAILMPLSDFAPEEIPPLDGKALVMQCAMGGRSMAAAEMVLDQLNIPVANLAGGITAWKSAGFPTEPGTSPDR